MRRLLVLTAAALLTLGIAGCGGDDGATGATGPQGPQGEAGPPGPGAEPTANADGELIGTVTAVTIDAATNQTVTVTFTLKDAAGLPVVGAEAKNFEFQVGKRVAASVSKPAYWQSYINRSDQEGTGAVVFIGGPERAKPTAVAGTPGAYTYKFCTPLGAAATFQYYGSGNSEPTGCGALVANAGAITGAAWDAFKPTLNLAYDAAATTRVTIVGRDGALVNLVQDFVPSTLPTLATARSAQLVTDASCGACHPENSAKRDSLRIGLGGHFGRRFQVEVCVMCHNAAGFNPETSTAASWKTLDLKVMLHDLHAAEFPQSGSFGGVSNIRNPTADIAGVDVGIPAGARPRFDGANGVINCRSCHDNQNDKVLPFQPTNRAAVDKTAWQTNISRVACQSCHDGTIGAANVVDFTNHFGNQSDDSQCALCHGTDKSAPVNGAHTTPYSTPNNPFLYPGAKSVKYEIASLTVDPATGIPTIKFRVLVGDPGAETAVNLKSPPAGVCVLANCQNGNSAAGLNFKLAWAKPMGADPVNGPRITKPADWNNWTGGARGYWNDGDPAVPNVSLGDSFRAFDQPVGPSIASIIGSLSDPDAQGYHTVTLAVGFPADPVYSTLTLKAVALESYLVINNYNISGEAVIKGVDGTQSTVRRQVVDMENCATCHERIGFHSNAGRAQNADYCAVCHNAEITSSNFYAGPVTVGGVVYQVSQKPNGFKDMVHSIHAGEMRKANNPADPFNFIRGNPAGGSGNGIMIFENIVYPARQYDCLTCHTAKSYGVPAGANLAWSAVDATAAVGTTNTSAGETAAPAGLYDPLKTVRIGPAQAACGSCHNSTSAKTHYLVNSASTGESCAVCHGPGAVFEAHK